MSDEEENLRKRFEESQDLLPKSFDAGAFVSLKIIPWTEITNPETSALRPRFSFTVASDVGTAADYAAEGLISLGYFSEDAEIWLENGKTLRVRDLFDAPETSQPRQQALFRRLSAKQEQHEKFGEIESVPNAFESPYTILSEVEKMIYDDGGIFTAGWYWARILRELSTPPGVADMFLIGILSEQVRIKLTHGDQFKNFAQRNDDLKTRSKAGTKAIVEKASAWQRHALETSRIAQAQMPWLRGRWSQLAAAVLDAVEGEDGDEVIRESYRGKQSKNKPDGSDLIAQETIARYLSKNLGD